MCTPARSDGLPDALDDALTEISSLASLMNEEKRDADSRLRLLDWQKRFTNSGRSPLVQPHRRLVMEGPLTLSRIVKKASTFVECETVVEGDGDHTIIPGRAVVPVDYVMPESVEREVMLILCSDMMVLATDRGEGWDGHVNVFNVLRMTSMIEPASLTGGNILRVVDNSVSSSHMSDVLPTNTDSVLSQSIISEEYLVKIHCSGVGQSTLLGGDERGGLA